MFPYPAAGKFLQVVLVGRFYDLIPRLFPEGEDEVLDGLM